MKPDQLILLFLLLVISAFKGKAQISVYSNESIIGKLNEKTVRTACENCYYQESIALFNKKIKIKIPVSIENGKLQTERILEISEKGNNKILKFNAVSDGSSNWLYLQKKRDRIHIIRKLSYSNAVYAKEIKKKDFDYLPATEVCTRNASGVINEEISFNGLFMFVPTDCYKCPIKTDVNDCIKNGKIKYNW
ncbi:hypothetical protein [Chryseobacterium jejuense]|uniref:Uncharacterized protein n=1 Tax=Chryseobacterium jejuense TaxID=445960 RepID=A0A2X2YXG8_CHRJE|nr:hypothetical protein [Chryseobacterium jejuense]SDJ92106.1 hypothetical protein SAMN05421542_4678 [Chryseobacterium jejuense]SQB43000.1 Uncharacterised protein [Chryseobacterium jejuense]